MDSVLSGRECVLGEEKDNASRRAPAYDWRLFRIPSAMHLLYEDEGDIKAGTVLSPGTASYQVEIAARASHEGQGLACRSCPSRSPGAAELLEPARMPMPASLDADFLWQCAGPAEFGLQASIAREYVGHEPDAVESALAILLKAALGTDVFLPAGTRAASRRHPKPRSRPRWPDLEKKRLQAEKAAELHRAAHRREHFQPELAALARRTALQARSQPGRDQGRGSGLQAKPA